MFSLGVIKKNIKKYFGLFDIIKSGSIERLKFCLILRESFNKSGYEKIHDSIIQKIISDVNKEAFITLDDAIGHKIFDKIYSMIQSEKNMNYKLMQSKTTRINTAIEFITMNFNTYNESSITKDLILLIFNRLCRKNTLVETYSDFEKLWSDF